MSEFDRREYERKQGEALRAVCQTMWGIPQVTAALEARSMLILTCPHGHKLFPVTLSSYHHDGAAYFQVEPLDGHGRATPVARPDTPFKVGKSPCLEPGCPTLVEGNGRCDVHGGRLAIDTAGISTRFECRVQSCGWSNRIPQAQLLKVVTAALVGGSKRVPVAGRGVPTR